MDECHWPKVLKEALLGLLITEPNMKGKIRRRRLKTLKRILSWSGFALFRCHSVVYLKEREREREQKHNTAKNRNEKRERMHEECMNM